jgi:hypothetical protein
LLGWVAGEVMATDPAIQPQMHAIFNGPVGVKLGAIITTVAPERPAFPHAMVLTVSFVLSPVTKMLRRFWFRCGSVNQPMGIASGA